MHHWKVHVEQQLGEGRGGFDKEGQKFGQFTEQRAPGGRGMILTAPNGGDYSSEKWQ